MKKKTDALEKGKGVGGSRKVGQNNGRKQTSACILYTEATKSLQPTPLFYAVN